MNSVSGDLAVFEDGSDVDRPSDGDSTPVQLRVGAKALVSDASRVLLVRERRSDGSTFWTLPGGGIESGESPVTALCRELREEIDCRPVVGRPLGGCVYDHETRPEKTVYAVYETAIAASPDPNWSEGVVDYGWYHPLDLPGATLDQFRRFLVSEYRTGSGADRPPGPSVAGARYR